MQVLIHIFWAGLFYLNYLLLAPLLLYKNRVIPFLLIMLFALVGVLYFNTWLDDVTGSREAILKAFNKKNNDENWNEDYWAIISALVILGVSSILAISKKIKMDQDAFQATEQENISTELSFLKAQINPHFFFNTLHTIYALTDTNTAAAKDAVYTLSHMMRYVIYDTKNDLTTLEKEIKFIDDFIKLMKLRLSNNVQIIFERPDNLKNYEVAPMLLLPFVENAFKHGLSDVQPSYIYIDISEQQNALVFEIKNSTFEEKSKYLEESNGIGIANTKRRLDLLYTGRYTLAIDNDTHSHEFTVKLTFNLK
ncbi:sensor histidine kinase [Mucilaginibacter pallidiroseus]|nr:histidine kinase [Mucilaginibacter pallidiroseus]